MPGLVLNTVESDVQEPFVPGMKWEDFLTVMREMGFTYDPNTAGFAVRFDPPDARDSPITFHKPYPDSTLSPVMLKEIEKRLKRCYGWEDDDFLRHAGF